MLGKETGRIHFLLFTFYVKQIQKITKNVKNLPFLG